ncbi:Dephospho-CoA kinase [Hartmannibacter diazotrophicus]|uniref:Dephospho-CoA kinase n=1 Tax=Hartmannibacter diazotrophicus TaxID=1482074 RepID=A0A2C9DDE9_9HYPH|nr:dephospho-CoA kinase [Hartmannibacter diazotrophicus]SON58190.1 Dephospho-CoA kinase [Hartmannibacter diazotrophicus]
MIVLGLTGSIGMGKSTTATMFREAGVPVHDADEAVHRLYSGPLAADIEALFPGTTRDGVVDRKALGATVLGEPDRLKALEALVHPAVRAEEKAFLDAARAKGAEVVVLDIPLLFETGRDKDVDAIVVVSAPDYIQRARVLARPEMTEEKFAAILGRQTPDSEKRARADFIVDSGQGLEKARADVAAILAALAARNMGKGRR